jgi:predicted MFS family arabinose efflux permease
VLGLIRERDFVLFLTSSTVSQLGDWALLLALPFYVYQRTGSVVSTGALVAVELLPRLLLSSAAGVLVDRWDRRSIMIGADLFRALLLLAILLPAAGAPLWIVYVVAVLEVSAAQLFLPAEGALLPSIVRHEGSLLAANSALSTSLAVSKLAGPPLGGLLFVTLGLGGSALVDSASFVLSALGILAIRPAGRAGAPVDTERTEPAARSSFLSELREGIAAVAGDRLVAALCLTLGVVMITQGLLETVVIPFVSGVLHFNPLQFGLIAAAQGLGALLGALGSGVLSRFLTSGRILGLALLLSGLFLAGFAFARSLELSAAFLFLFSAPMVVAATWSETYYQQRVNDNVLGRVLGVAENVSAAGILIGVIVGALLGGPLGPVAVLVLAAGVVLVSALLAFGSLREARTTSTISVGREGDAAAYGE